jgi:predicted dehydrogenase
MQKLRAAVIGVGYLGRLHVQKFAALEDAGLVAVVDIDRIKAEDVSRRVKAAAYTDYREILGHIDLVSIAVPTENHYPIARACLKAGIHVLVEKPMTRTLEEAEHLIELAKSHGCVLQVGHLERFSPALLALRGTLNHPLFIESHRITQFRERGTDVSVVLDLMIHDIDLILSMVDSPIVAIRPMGFPVLTEEIDIANARLEFANGCVAHVTASRVSRSLMRKMRLFQPDSYISIDYLEHTIAICRRLYDQSRVRIVEEVRSFRQGDALMLEIRAFVEAVKNGTPPVVSGEEGKRALAVALAISHAIRQKPGFQTGPV